MKNLSKTEGKLAAIISYITFIGVIIAFIINQKEQNRFASFHIRQAIGIHLIFFIINLLTRYGNSFGIIDNILYIGATVLLIIGLIAAIQEKEKQIPFLGDKFQEWFKNIG